MRFPLLPVVAALLAGCMLPDTSDLEFVDGPVVDDGRLVRDFRFDDGSSDCRVEIDLARAYAQPDDGCDDCDVALAVDLVVSGDDCDQTPPEFGTTRYDISIGFDGDEAWSRETGIWERWLDGDRDGSSFEGAGSRSGTGFELDEDLDVAWFGD